jgi:hypothetical protein
MIMHPNPSLVGSQYSPQQFSKHYMSGSTRHYEGKVIFAEIDIEYRHPYFKLDKLLQELIPHEDGKPKATKFISTYRVLEHIDFGAIQRLYLTTPSAAVLGLDSAPYEKTHYSDFLRIFAEIVPTRMLVLSRLNFPEFGKAMTNPQNPKGVPKMFYTQIELDIAYFMSEFTENPFLNTPITSVHPSKLRDAVIELQNKPEKTTKGLSLDSDLNSISYKYIRHGFMFASQEEAKFFPMPLHEEVENVNFQFWRDM